jgi:DNA-binding XRE family transcriptional regulator
LKTYNSAFKCTIRCIAKLNPLILLKKSGIMHFGKLILQIKNRRNELQITQETLAEISGVGLRTLKEFESGKGNPTLQTVCKLAGAMGLELYFQIKPTTAIE